MLHEEVTGVVQGVLCTVVECYAAAEHASTDIHDCELSSFPLLSIYSASYVMVHVPHLGASQLHSYHRYMS